MSVDALFLASETKSQGPRNNFDSEEAILEN